MRIVVVGATGNVGTAVLGRLAHDPAVNAVNGIARRPPKSTSFPYSEADWLSVDVGAPGTGGRLVDCFTGAAAVIHLAWQIQPSHERHRLRRTNVDGSARVAEAAVRAGVPALVVASSVGAYAPGPKDRRVGEDWPVTGVSGSSYSRDKADVEAILDVVQQRHPDLRLVRMRPGLIFQRAAASEIARFFAGPLAPVGLLRFGRLPIVPKGRRLRLQAVHASDVAEAYVRAALGDARGAFNLVAEPVLDAASVAARFGGVKVPVPIGALRAAAAATWYARLQPVEPGWIDLAAGAPLLSSRRAEVELDWRPQIDALDTIAELFNGMAHRVGADTAPLRRRAAVPARTAAILAGHLPGHGDPY